MVTEGDGLLYVVDALVYAVGGQHGAGKMEYGAIEVVY